MGVPIEVPGLDQFLPELPDGSVLLLEGGLAPGKNQLARTIAQSAAKLGRKVTLFSSRPDGESASGNGVHVAQVDSWPTPSDLALQDAVIDSFSLLSMGEAPAAVAVRLRELKAGCVADRSVAVLVVDDHQLDARTHAACHHLADAVVQFHQREEPERSVPFLRIAKTPDGRSLDRNIFYGMDGRTLLIDTRRRVN